MAPSPNPRVLAELSRADAILYGMGSLYTSIAPSLVLKGVGECIAAADVPKVGWGVVQGAVCSAVRRGAVRLLCGAVSPLPHTLPTTRPS